MIVNYYKLIYLFSKTKKKKEAKTKAVPVFVDILYLKQVFRILLLYKVSHDPYLVWNVLTLKG